MHRLLKSLYIRHVSADYRFASFRDVTYKLHLHHYSWPQIITTHSLLCHLYLDEPNQHCHYVYSTYLCGDGLVTCWKMPYVW
jgi:hypothetical protein